MTQKMQKKDKFPSKRFSKVQQMEIFDLIGKGYENQQILDFIQKKYAPENNVFSDSKKKHTFLNRLQYYRNVFHSDENFKQVTSSMKQGLCAKELRISVRKKNASQTLEKIANLDQTDTKNYLNLKSMLLNELEAIAKEMGDWKTSGINVNIDQRKVIFEGKAVVPRLQKHEMDGLEVISPDALPEKQHNIDRNSEDN